MRTMTTDRGTRTQSLIAVSSIRSSAIGSIPRGFHNSSTKSRRKSDAVGKDADGRDLVDVFNEEIIYRIFKLYLLIN